MIKVLVNGALGKMGSEVINAVNNCEDMELISVVDCANIGVEISKNIHIEGNLKDAIKAKTPDVVVDFTQPDVVFENAKICLENNTRPVIGTTGLQDEQIEEIKKLATEKNLGCLIAPNFSTGAVLMMMFAKHAAKYFDNAEIIEFHHNQKKDAPSGTSIKTAKMMAEEKSDFTSNNCLEKEIIQASRGGICDSNIHIHSVRMPGFMASQEVLFGSNGQILTIRHDSSDRKCYMQGILLAIKHVVEKNDFTYGLEHIL